jgi:hypothetical protein
MDESGFRPDLTSPTLPCLDRALLYGYATNLDRASRIEFPHALARLETIISSRSPSIA